ncbi:DUF5011 domain-containing protein [Vagococcus sp. BWB3-3]|uniref:DUF5011 domain-containing protein n=1 Tax=Vagococcus allomyrinae TaxID=2794353 RepID=A0A940PAW6_9ENTE|nr:immunoglobulin-like domain-containing protein [Vagococcus allomyrinae]MBP1040071.1 DUF5011 domain-containing protein [Vagococcus allomyrinae]
MKSKKLKGFLLLALMANTALSLANPTFAQATELSSEISQILNDQVRLESGVSYIDAAGQVKEITIPSSAAVTLSASSSTVSIRANGQTHNLKNVQEITFKKINVSKLVCFSANTVKKITLDGVNFQGGVKFSGLKSLQSLIVKNSTFGGCGYSIAVYSAPVLNTLLIDNSTLKDDLRIYSNKSLTEATVSNSVLKSDAKQFSNKKGYRTNFVNTRFDPTKCLRDISSGGRSADDIFFMNPDNTAIGASRFNAATPGKILYTGADNVVNTVDIPAYTAITTVKDVKDSVTIRLSNGQTHVLNGVKELYFRNVDIQTPLAFQQKYLRLEKLQIVNSRTRSIKVACSQTLKAFEIHGSELSHSSANVSLSSNKALESFIVQDSTFTGGSCAGSISVAHSPSLKQFIMNNDYMSGYLSTCNIGSVVLQLSNSQYDDRISSANEINGVAGPQIVGYLPVIEASDRVHSKGEQFDPIEGVKAYDFEDGDLMSVLVIDDSLVNADRNGVYPVTYTVTDSDNNMTTLTIQVTVN